MSFKKGAAPIRHSLHYLEAAGTVIFKHRVKVLILNYNEAAKYLTYKTEHPRHQGAKEFAFWTLPQIQYKNPSLQVIALKNMTPSPYVTCLIDHGEKVIFDVDGQTKEEIHERLKKTLGKTEMTSVLRCWERLK